MFDVEIVRQRGVVPPAHRGQLGAGTNDARRHHRQHPVPVGAVLAADQGGEVQLFKCGHDRLNCAVLAGFEDLERILSLRQSGAAEVVAYQFDQRLGQMGDVGDGFLLGAAVAVSVTGADEDGSIGFAALVGDHVADVHCGWHAVHVLPT